MDQKHLGVTLLTFDEQLNNVLNKVRSILITTYKAFVRSHLDHGDILYD